MRTHQGFFIVALLLLVACADVTRDAAPQETLSEELGTVSGYVSLRKAGQPVAGTTVNVVGQKISAETDENGFYSLRVPEGIRILEFRQEGYATSRVEGLRVRAGETTFYDTVQLEYLDPYLPTEPPELNTSVHNGDRFMGEGDEDTFSFVIDGEVAAPDLNGFVFAAASLGQSRGASDYLSEFVPGAPVDFDGDETNVTLSAEGFAGETTLHVVAYDLNQNRTENIRYVEVVSGANNLAEIELDAQAITFNDVGSFNSLGVTSQNAAQSFSTAELMQAVRSNDAAALGRMAQSFTQFTPHLAPDALGAQDTLDEYLIWVDLFFDYDFAAGAELPTAFQIYRKLEGERDFRLIGQVSPRQADLGGEDPASTTFGYRDATPALQPGLGATYRVVATRGAHSAASEPAQVTPLDPFFVDANTPRNGATGVALLPDYDMTFRGRSDLVYYSALVLDRVHASDNVIEWFSEFIPDDSGVTSVAVPHNVDGTAVTETLQPFHTYDWQPPALTTNGRVTKDGVKGENAISVASDFFDFFQLFEEGGGVQDGPVNTFTTGTAGAESD